MKTTQLILYREIIALCFFCKGHPVVLSNHNKTKYFMISVKHNNIFFLCLCDRASLICGIMHRRCCLQAASLVHYTTNCKHSLVLLRMGEIIRLKHVELIVIINKNLLLLHLVGCLCYFITMIYILYYVDRMFRSIDHHQAIFTKIRIRCMLCR